MTDGAADAFRDNLALAATTAAADREAIAILRARCERLEKHNVELQHALEFDRTKVAECMTAANRAIDRRHWLTEGRGCYEWNDDRWHQEFFAAAVEIKKALEPLTKIAANWSGCPMKSEDVARARIDLKAALAERDKRITELEAALDGARKDTERLHKWIASAFHPDGCACIKDMPGDNCTCGAHSELWRIGFDAARRESGNE